MNIHRVITGGFFIFFLFIIPMDIQELITEGSLSFFVDFGEYSFLVLVFDFVILFSTYHDTWGRGRNKNG